MPSSSRNEFWADSGWESGSALGKSRGWPASCHALISRLVVFYSKSTVVRYVLTGIRQKHVESAIEGCPLGVRALSAFYYSGKSIGGSKMKGGRYQAERAWPGVIFGEQCLVGAHIT